MGDEPPQSIKHRGLAYHYTAYITPLVNRAQRPCIPLHF